MAPTPTPETPVVPQAPEAAPTAPLVPDAPVPPAPQAPAPAPVAPTAPTAGAAPATPPKPQGLAPKGMTHCPFGGGAQCKAHGGDGAYFHKMSGNVMKAHMQAGIASQPTAQPQDSGVQKVPHPQGDAYQVGGKLASYFFFPDTGKIITPNGAQLHWEDIKDVPKFGHNPEVLALMEGNKSPDEQIHLDHNIPDAVVELASSIVGVSHSGAVPFDESVYPLIHDKFPPPGSIIPLNVTSQGKGVYGIVTPYSVDFYNEDGTDVSLPLSDGQTHSYLDLTKDGTASVILSFADKVLGIVSPVAAEQPEGTSAMSGEGPGPAVVEEETPTGVVEKLPPQAQKDSFKNKVVPLDVVDHATKAPYQSLPESPPPHTALQLSNGKWLIHVADGEFLISDNPEVPEQVTDDDIYTSFTTALEVGMGKPAYATADQEEFQALLEESGLAGIDFPVGQTVNDWLSDTPVPSEETSGIELPQDLLDQEAESTAEEMVDCPFGGGAECKSHGGDGASQHEPGGAVMQAHAAYGLVTDETANYTPLTTYAQLGDLPEGAIIAVDHPDLAPYAIKASNHVWYPAFDPEGKFYIPKNMSNPLYTSDVKLSDTGKLSDATNKNASHIVTGLAEGVTFDAEGTKKVKKALLAANKSVGATPLGTSGTVFKKGPLTFVVGPHGVFGFSGELENPTFNGVHFSNTGKPHPWIASMPFSDAMFVLGENKHTPATFAPLSELSEKYPHLSFEQKGDLVTTYPEEYPEFLPAPGTTVEAPPVFASQQTSPKPLTLVCGPHGVTLHSPDADTHVNVLGKELELPKLSTKGSGGVFVSYDKENHPFLQKLMDTLGTPTQDLEEEALKTSFEEGDVLTIKPNHSSFGLTLHKLTSLPIGATVSFTGSVYGSSKYVLGDWQKVGTDTWKKLYSDGKKGAATLQTELASKIGSTYKVKYSTAPSGEEALKLAQKAAKKAKKLAKEGTFSLPDLFVHKDQLIEEGINQLHLKNFDLKTQNNHGVAELPPVGSIMEVESPKYGKTYMLFHSGGISCYAKVGDQWQAIHPSKPASTYPDKFRYLMASLHDQGAMTYKAALQKAKILGQDFSKYSSAQDLMADVPKTGVSFVSCIYGGDKECKSHGGDGAHYHHQGYVHALTKTTGSDPDIDTWEAPSTWLDAVKADGAPKKNTDYPWAPVGSAYQHLDPETGIKHHLYAGQDAFVLSTEYGTQTIPYSTVAAHEGLHPQLGLDKYNIKYFKSDYTFHPAGKGVPFYIKQKLNYQGSIANPVFGMGAGGVFSTYDEDGNQIYFWTGHYNSFHVHSDSSPLSGPVVTALKEQLQTAQSTGNKPKVKEYVGAPSEFLATQAPFKSLGVFNENNPNIADVPQNPAIYAWEAEGGEKAGYLPIWAYKPGTLLETQDHYVAFGLNGATVQVYNKDGKLADNLYDTYGAGHAALYQNFLQKYNVLPKFDPEETWKNGNKVYGVGIVPNGTPPTVTNAVSNVISAAGSEAENGFPAPGKLHVALDSTGATHYVINDGYNTSIYTGSGDKLMTLFNEEVEPKEAATLQNLGFDVTASTTGDTEKSATLSLSKLETLPDINTLKATGQKLGGGQNPNEVFVDDNGNKYLWKPLPKGYHHFVVHSEAAGSAMAAKILGGGAVHGVVQSKSGTKGLLQKVLPDGTQLIGKNVGPLDLQKAHGDEIIHQFGAQHVLDWFISNHDSHGNQFLVSPTGQVVGIDKGQAFKHFGKDDESLSLGYAPNGDTGEAGPYAYRVWNAIQDGSLKVDQADMLKSVAGTIQKIQALSNKDLQTHFQDYLDARFGDNQAAKSDFIKNLAARRDSLRTDFEHLLSNVYGKQVNLSEHMEGMKVLTPSEVHVFPDSSNFSPSGVTYTKVVTPAEYETVTETKSLPDLVSSGAFPGISVKPHIKKDYLLSVFAPDASAAQDFLEKTGLSPIGNQVDANGNALNGIKPTPHGALVVVHKDAYNAATKTFESQKLKTAEKVEMVPTGDTSADTLPKDAFTVAHPSGKTQAILPYTSMDHPELVKHYAALDGLHLTHIPSGGHLAMLGSEHVSGTGGMTVRRLKGLDGGEYMEAELKVPDHIRDALKVYALPKKNTTYAQYNPDSGTYEEMSQYTSAKDHLTFPAHVLKVGGVEVHIASGDLQHADSGIVSDTTTSFTMRGTIRVRIPVEHAEKKGLTASIQKALSRVKTSHAQVPNLGALIKAPTEQSHKFQLLKQACAHGAVPPKAYRSLDLSKPDQAIPKMEKLLEKHGVNTSALKFAQTANGFYSVIEQGKHKKYLDKMNFLTNGVPLKHIAAQVKHGVLSHKLRVQHGLDGKTVAGGMASKDIVGGGAESVFFRLDVISGAMNAPEGSYSLIPTPHIFDRLDMHWSTGDVYGAYNPKGGYTTVPKDASMEEHIDKNHSKHSPGGSNELMVKGGLPMSAMLGLYVDSSYKPKLMEYLASAGIHQINGIPVEDFVITDQAKAKKLWKDAGVA